MSRKTMLPETPVSKPGTQSLLDALHEAVCGVSRDGRTTFCNEALLQLTGYQADEFVGRNLHDLVHHSRRNGDHYAEHECALLQAIEQGKSAHYDGDVFWRRDGTCFPVEYWAHPIGEVLDDTTHLVTFIDATQHEKTRNDLHSSEEKLRIISGYAALAFYLVDLKQGAVVYMSPAYQRLTGTSFDAHDSGLCPWKRLAVSEDRALLEQHCCCIAQGHEITSEFRIRHADGAVRWLKDSVRPILGEDNQVVMATGVAHDITEVKEARDALVKSEQKFRRILSAVPDVLWTSDSLGRTIYISPRVHRVLGYSSQEIYEGGEELWFGCIHADDADRVRKAYLALFDQRRKFDEEYRIRRKDGEWIWVHDRARCTHEAKGILYADGVFSDVTDRKRAEAEIRSKTAFLEALTHSTMDGLLVVDDQRNRLLFNDRFASIFTIPRELLQGSDDTPTLAHVSSLVKNRAAFLQRIDYLHAHPMETSRDEIELKDGTVLDRYSSPVVGKDGKYYGRIWSFRDITELRRNEGVMRQLSFAVEQSSVSIVITDSRGEITYVNRKFSETAGYSREEVLGKNPRLLKSGHAQPELYKQLWSTILAGNEWRGELCNKKKNGELYWEAVSITPITDLGGNITHFVAIEEDITERRTLEQQLRHSQKLEGIGQLAAGIAHEINTPTQFVSDNLTFLSESWQTLQAVLQKYRTVLNENAEHLPEVAVADLRNCESSQDLEYIATEAPRAIEQALDGARRVAGIVRAMKEFSHPDSTEKSATNLNRAIESTIIVARNEWKYVADVETAFDSDLPAVVCYPSDFNQVILNLLVNAAHAIQAVVTDGHKGKISVRTQRMEGRVQIVISDTGAGIPEAIRSRIFDPFFTTKEVGKGTGQGLSFAYSAIVKKHSGKIWFETEVGRGTTFFLEIPVSPLDPVRS